MARYALERIPASEAGQALRDALPKVSGAVLVGVIGSLGVRRDAASVPALAALLNNADASVARAAAIALGDIGTAEAAKALADGKPTTPEATQAATDASLACAEELLAGGKKVEALAVYKSLVGRRPTEAGPPGSDSRHAGLCRQIAEWRRRVAQRNDTVKCNRLLPSVLACGALVCIAVVWGMTATASGKEEAADELVTLIVGLLGDKDKDLRAVGLDQIRDRSQRRGGHPAVCRPATEAVCRCPGRLAQRLGRSGRRGSAPGRGRAVARDARGAGQGRRDRSHRFAGRRE